MKTVRGQFQTFPEFVWQTKIVTSLAVRQVMLSFFLLRNAHIITVLFLLSCKAGGVGLNLVGASRIVLYDIDWNPANDLQAMARIWRDGQGRHVFIYRLLTTGTIEEKMYQRQVTKQGLSGIVLENNKGSKKAKFSLEDLKDLFTLEEETSSSTHRLLQCLCDNENDPDIVTPLGSSPPNSNSDPTTQRSCQLGKLPDNKLIEEVLHFRTYWQMQEYGVPANEQLKATQGACPIASNIGAPIFRQKCSRKSWLGL